MPTTKNAFIRYKHLDRLLSDHHHYFDRKTLTEKVNAALEFDGFKKVDKRTIENDIKDLKDAPFNAPIEEFKKNGKIIVTYSDPSFSIFKKEMSDEERDLLREVMNTIGQFEGLDHFQWLDDFKKGLGVKEHKKVISFSHNPYLNNSNLGKLFDCISNEVAIRLSYHTYANKTVRSIDFHPYLLKQYNDRWFLLGAADSDKKILTFALDRIDMVDPLLEKNYLECPENLSERFEDIVGVTLYEDRPLEHILLWVSDYSKDYIDTKPFHGSYTALKGEKEKKLRKLYPQLNGGTFFTIDCIRNYELIRELCSFGKELLVLSEGTVKDEVEKRIREMMEEYDKLRHSNP